MTINCRGELLDLTQPKVMGILNLTDDSFFDGGKYQNQTEILKRVEKMVEEKVDIIDLGAQSSRSGATMHSADFEIEKLEIAIQSIKREFPNLILSIDTFWSKVAKMGIENGAHIINDISAGNIDEDMLNTVAELSVPYVLMHMKGTPGNMQKNPTYENVLIEVNQFFSEKIQVLLSKNVKDIILDPGYGFGKTVENNYQLLKNQQLLGFGDFPILAGVSRKSMVTKLLNISAKEALNGTTSLHMLALQNGANILRVHDVAEAKECIAIYLQYLYS